MSRSYDIVIVGGGLVGLSLALALQQIRPASPLRVAVIEASPLASGGVGSPSFDSRSTALSHSTGFIYRQLGIWQALEKQAAPIREIHVSEQGRWGATRMRAEDHHLEAFGWVAPNQCLGQVLTNAFEERCAADLLAPVTVERVVAQDGGYQIELREPGQTEAAATLESRLLVLADGGRSGLAGQLGITYESRDYEQHAIIANLGLQKPHNGVAYERFTRTGAMALLPLETLEGMSRAALVWTVPSRQAQGLMAESDEALIERLHGQFGYRSGRIVRIGERQCYPLQLRKAKEQVRPGLVLLGNAAHTLHPVAGQGYNLALRDAMALAEQISRLSTPEELGSMTFLERYLQQQEGDQWRTVNGSDGLINLFGSRQPWLQRGRQAGLIGLNLLLPLKHQFAEVAMGMADSAAQWNK